MIAQDKITDIQPVRCISKGTVDGVTTIVLRRRVTKRGQYFYQKKGILTTKRTVKTGQWKDDFRGEIGRLV